MGNSLCGMGRFKDKNVLVIGGGAGMGRATAYRLAKEGACVAVADRDAEAGKKTVAAIKELGGEAFFQQVELTDLASMESMGKAVGEKMPVLNALVTTAGIGAGGGMIERDGDLNWDILMNINLKASVMVARAVLPLLKKEGGAVVNVTSDGGFRGRAGCWIYDATKAGLWSATKSMAAEFCKYGIRVNNVSPGWAVTEFHFGNAQDPQAKKKEMEEMDSDYCMMRRLGRPEEIAAAIAFLASDDASYVTATTLCVDGGRVGMDF